MPADLRERLALAIYYANGYLDGRWEVFLPHADAALRTIAEALREPASAGMCRATVDESGLIATLPADVWERMAAAWLREQGVTDA